MGVPGPQWPGSGRAASTARPGPPVLDGPIPEPEAGASRRAPRTLEAGGRLHVLAGFWWRAGSFAIDVATIWVGLVIITGIWGGATGAGEVPVTADAVPQELLIASWVLQIGYYWICNSIGWSAGKRVLGLRLVTGHGAAPGAGRGLARTVMSLVSALPFGLGFLWAAWDRRTQTWHDRVAGTYVVRVGGQAQPGASGAA